MKSVWFLEDIDIFKFLCPHKYDRFKSTHKINLFSKGDYIYTQDDSADKVHLINQGKVKIGYYTEEGNEVITSILTKGDIFGEKAILGQERRNEFARAVDKKTSVCSTSLDVIHELLRENEKFSLKIYKILGLRLTRLERRLQLLLFKDSKTRLMEFLDDLSIDYGHCCPKTGDTVIEHPYTQKDIAGLIGTSRPNLNILLNDLRKDGIVNFNRKEIRITNLMA